VAFTSAHSYVNPALLTFGLRLQLVAVALGAYLLFPSERETIRSARYLCGLGLLVAGIAGVLLGGGNLGEGSNALGIALAIAAGMGYGVYGLAVRRFMYGFHPVYAFGVIALYTGSALVVAMLAFGRGHGAEVLDLGSRERTNGKRRQIGMGVEVHRLTGQRLAVRLPVDATGELSQRGLHAKADAVPDEDLVVPRALNGETA